jgi:hypothetical protein
MTNLLSTSEIVRTVAKMFLFAVTWNLCAACGWPQPTLSLTREQARWIEDRAIRLGTADPENRFWWELIQTASAEPSARWTKNNNPDELDS